MMADGLTRKFNPRRIVRKKHTFLSTVSVKSLLRWLDGRAPPICTTPTSGIGTRYHMHPSYLGTWEMLSYDIP